MDLQTLLEKCAKVQCPRFDERKHRLQTLEWVRTRRWPKELKLPDFDARTNPVTKKWRPFAERRPGARYDIHAIVTRDVVAMLAGDGRFPIVTFQNDDDTKKFAEAVRTIGLAAILNQAATLASIGSVCVVPEVIAPGPDAEPDAKPWLSVQFWRAYEVDPVFRSDRPDVLKSVPRTWSVSRAQLIADGYDMKALDARGAVLLGDSTLGRRRKPGSSEYQFKDWYRRAVLDEKRHVNYAPVPKEVYHQADWDKWEEDPDRSVDHDLGFCPAWWYTTYDDQDARPDGACIFEAAVDNAILIDRVLSVAANAVVAAGTPQLAVVKKGSSVNPDVLAGGAASPASGEIDPDSILEVDEKGGAWLVQLEGGLTPLDVVLKRLRNITLENVGGSRLSEETAAGAKSGYAMELLNQALTYVSGLMRPGYEKAAIGFVRLIARMVVEIGDIECEGGVLPKAHLAPLVTAEVKAVSYGPNYELSGQDKQFEVTSITAAVSAGLLSLETAIAQVAQLFDITDVDGERKRVEAEKQVRDAADQANANTEHKRALELQAAKATPQEGAYWRSPSESRFRVTSTPQAWRPSQAARQ